MVHWFQAINKYTNTRADSLKKISNEFPGSFEDIVVETNTTTKTV